MGEGGGGDWEGVGGMGDSDFSQQKCDGQQFPGHV